MKHKLRLSDYLEHMQQAAALATSYVKALDKASFLQDKRTQQAVMMNLVILGEAAGNVVAVEPVFAQDHPEIPWRVIRATRNRMAHGYFDINLDVIWDTVQTALPALLQVLPRVIDAARRDDASPPPPSAAS